MRYIIADKAAAVDVGFSLMGHKTNGNQILLNEKEVAGNPTLKGSLTKRAKAIQGTVYSEAEVMNLINSTGGLKQWH